MVRLREIPRTAAFVWSPGSDIPFIATGTRAGAVDADFSDETKLELWSLKLDDAEQGIELQPVFSIAVDSRFHDIAWAPASEGHPRGIIAGALENGSLDLWDAQKLIDQDDGAHISRTTKHTGAIKSLQFNPLKPQILATAGTKGELYIYDVQNISEPYRLGTAAARSDDLECVAWNRRVPHILATGGSGGFVTVWDLKTKKASLTLNNQRKAVSAIAWDPNNATKLLTATPDDTTPVILLWDLRQNSAPERTLEGHLQGVLSLSWCQQDSDLLLSCGKDNKTICWNPRSGENLGELSEVTNWTFQTQFHPHNPNLSATASFDGKISVQTLQNTKSEKMQAPASIVADGEDFFTKAQSQPQEASFSLRKAPKWLERPVGATFGYGGKLITFRQRDAAAGQPRISSIAITKFLADTEFEGATEVFETALKSGDMSSICENHIAAATTDEEKADWQVIQTLTTESGRKGITEYLGLSSTEEAATSPKDQTSSTDEALSTENRIPADASAKNNRLSTLFTEGDDGDDFLSSLSATKDAKTNNPFQLLSDSDSAADQQITKALMLGQFEQAMKTCLQEDRMADAFMIANCGGKELVEKVQAAYLARSAKGPSYFRLLASVIDKNLWDIVHNADLQNWRESMATLCTYATPDEFPDLCEALGDRVLENGSRKDASFCYLVGTKLEKVVNIWIDELEETKASALSDTKGVAMFSLHARYLQSFIEKVTVFRNVTKFEDTERDSSSGWKLSSLYDRYVEYADLVASHGHLSIAEKYLSLIPQQYPEAEASRSRVKKASSTSVVAPAVQARQPVSTRATARALPVNNTQPINAYQPVNNFQPAQTPTVAPPAVANPYAPPATAPNSNPYAPPSMTNPYAPQPGYIPPQPSQQQFRPPQFGGPIPTPSPYGVPPQNNFIGTTSSGPPPPAEILTYQQKKTAEQWNDIPNVAKPKVARRSTPVQSASVANQANLMMPQATAPYGGTRATPPPPPKVSGPPPPARVTSPLAAPPSNSMQQLSRTPSASANMYAPPLPSQPQPQAQQYLGQGPPVATLSRGASPYNAPPSSNGPPSSNRYAPAPAPAQSQYSQAQPAPTQVAPPPPSTGNRPPPPSNPYAPLQQQTQQQPQGQFMQQASGTFNQQGQGQYGQQSQNQLGQQPQGQYSSNSQGQYSQQPSVPSPYAPQGGTGPAGLPQNRAQPPPPPPLQGPPRSVQQGPPANQSSQLPPQATAQSMTQAPAQSGTTPSQSRTATPAAQKFPAGDRSHIPAAAQSLFNIFSADMQRVSAAAPASFAPQVKDTQKRLNILYDHLNNEELLSAETIQQLNLLAQALQNKDFETASRLQMEIQKEKTAECGNWMVGVKRLIGMSKVTA